MYFHEGYGLHGVTWHSNSGHPMSHGCVNLPTPEAEWLFNWAEVGMLVDIHEWRPNSCAYGMRAATTE
jgi:lipoprotein-anchoring transpeptidase ErfK/SrfK